MAKLAESPGVARAASGFSSRAMALRDAIGLALVFIVAAVTRLTYLDLAEFKGDEAHVAGLAALLLDHHVFPLIGIVSSVGINNPPIFVLLMALPLAINRDPVVATGFIGLLGVGTALLTYQFCAEHFDRRTALVAALLFAAAPWAVVLNRKMQAQDVVPFFTILWMGALFQFARGRGAAHLVGVAVWLSVLVQLHQAAVALIPITLLALALRWRLLLNRNVFRWGAVAVALAGALWIPYLIFQLTHGWADLNALLRLERQPVQVGFGQFVWIVELAASNGYNGLTGVGYPAYSAATYSFDGLYLAERLLFDASVLFLVGRLAWTRGRAPGDWRFAVLLLWLVVPPLFFIRSTSPLYPHYFADVFPAQFILIGLLISAALVQVGRGRSRLAREGATALVGVLVTAIVAAQVYGLIAVMTFIGSGPTLDAHGVPLRDLEAAANHLVTFAAGSSKPVYLAVGGNNYPLAFAYLVGGRVPQQFFDDGNTFVSPADDGQPTLYLSGNPDGTVAALLRQRFGGDRIDLVPFPGQSTGFEIYRLPSNAGARLLNDPPIRPIDRTAPNGARLVGYQIAPRVDAGTSVRLALYWQVVAPPPPGTDYAFFTHLIDDQSRVWGQQDGLGYAPMFWHPGDVVVSWFTLDARKDLPSETGWIEAGMYDRNGIKRLPLRAADGSAPDRVLLGPLQFSGK